MGDVFECYYARNKKYHRCACDNKVQEERVLREWQCPYLEVTSLGHTVMPLGGEFQELVNMLTASGGKADDAAATAGGLSVLTSGMLNVLSGVGGVVGVGGGGGGAEDRGSQDRPGDKMLAGITVYLKGLQGVIGDTNSTDDEREAAEDACGRTVPGHVVE